ncbi:hypothetical protein L211DRAFT_359826 [Terfezia boudieri ATCC MYA-4762]|uniref:Uncharacterized protein n=1 Tax=Terfezia boudieri ATCC MYA-4762 TaxID=1051890 RepID=A0A3N4LGN9_9PEZI|nr:hypothetical protein L211DRAFT_359826 [Terfezia boudieri ATCC MYA-4762]
MEGIRTCPAVPASASRGMGMTSMELAGRVHGQLSVVLLVFLVLFFAGTLGQGTRMLVGGEDGGGRGCHGVRGKKKSPDFFLIRGFFLRPRPIDCQSASYIKSLWY